MERQINSLGKRKLYSSGPWKQKSVYCFLGKCSLLKEAERREMPSSAFEIWCVQTWCIELQQPLCNQDTSLRNKANIAYTQKVRLKKNFCSWWCWNNFLSPRWSHSYSGCHISKPKLRKLPSPSEQVPCDQKCSISSQPIRDLQANSGPSHPKQGWLCGPNQSK